MAFRIYNWQEWFRRGRFALRHGVDFHCSSDVMAQQVRNAAQRHAKGKWVKIRMIERNGSEVLVVDLLRRREPTGAG